MVGGRERRDGVLGLGRKESGESGVQRASREVELRRVIIRKRGIEQRIVSVIR